MKRADFSVLRATGIKPDSGLAMRVTGSEEGRSVVLNALLDVDWIIRICRGI